MKGGPALGFACRCGALRGEVTNAAPATFTHAVCHCGDCRSAYTHLGLADPGQVGVIQTTQDRIRIAQGGEHLRAFRHTPRGALRWYAGCCGTPLFYTPLKPRLVHVSLNTDRLDAPSAAGKVQAEGFIPAGDGRTRHKGALRMVARMASRILAENLSGAWRRTPFFDTGGNPARPPHVLTPEERMVALKAVGR